MLGIGALDTCWTGGFKGPTRLGIFRNLPPWHLGQAGSTMAALPHTPTPAHAEFKRLLLMLPQECATILYQEIDYINEGRNADRWEALS